METKWSNGDVLEVGDPVRALHFSEVYWGMEERIRCMRQDSARDPSLHPLPIFYYHKDNGEVWGPLYPKAGKVHNKNIIRYAHLWNLRTMLGSEGDYYDWPTDEDETNDFYSGGGGPYEPSIRLKENFLRYEMQDGNNIFYGWAYPHNASKELHQDAFGADRFTDVTKVSADKCRISHINEPRRCIEKLHTILIQPSAIEYQEKIGLVHASDYFENYPCSSGCCCWEHGMWSNQQLWDIVVDDLNSNSWGSWQNYSLDGNSDCLYFWKGYRRSGYDNCGDCDGMGAFDELYISIRRFRLTFDLDLEIVGTAGWPPSNHPYDSWPNIMPPLMAKMYVCRPYSHRSSFGMPLIKNITTGNTVNVTLDEFEETYGYSDKDFLLEGDIINYFGSGHGQQKFVFSSINDWSAADIQAIMSTSVDEGGTSYWSNSGDLHELWKIYTGIDVPGIYIICKPQFRFSVSS